MIDFNLETVQLLKNLLSRDLFATFFWDCVKRRVIEPNGIDSLLQFANPCLEIS